MNTIDAFSLDRIEVLRGSGSVQYGSDALGGVINLITPLPRLTQGGVSAGGAVATRLVRSGMEQTARAEGYVAGPRLGARGGVTLRSFGDVVAGGSLGTEAPSATTSTTPMPPPSGCRRTGRRSPASSSRSIKSRSALRPGRPARI